MSITFVLGGIGCLKLSNNLVFRNCFVVAYDDAYLNILFIFNYLYISNLKILT